MGLFWSGRLTGKDGAGKTPKDKSRSASPFLETDFFPEGPVIYLRLTPKPYQVEQGYDIRGTRSKIEVDYDSDNKIIALHVWLPSPPTFKQTLRPLANAHYDPKRDRLIITLCSGGPPPWNEELADTENPLLAEDRQHPDDDDGVERRILVGLDGTGAIGGIIIEHPADNILNFMPMSAT